MGFGSISNDKHVFVSKPIVPKKEGAKSKALNGYENIREKVDDSGGTKTASVTDTKKKKYPLVYTYFMFFITVIYRRFKDGDFKRIRF